jgi:hypothetical protein
VAIGEAETRRLLEDAMASSSYDLGVETLSPRAL